ncbi:MAG: MBL fold metallo-hydrolase [Burkholderiales bacterium]|nr:MBL fold metallo-hydrolase [Burkholderiales bacterium]MDE1926441.1 MBL fold metallo-hydrolase [Burkholderiales bacterium]MDE2160189.1 MBL fold metallo-hydrolase [Burkholderiales bacterium]MDE2503820.1 MBL fold metallo-hydrolase [Burkholderiales bacterium]
MTVTGIAAPGAGLSYPFAAPAADGSAVEVAPGLLWLRMPMPMALDHINVYLLQADEGWFIVDTGLDTPTTREIWRAVIARLPGPVAGVVCTHFHYDHAGLAAWLSETHDVPLWMTHGEYYMLRATAAPLPDPLPPLQQRHYDRSGMPPERQRAMLAALRRDGYSPAVPQAFRRLRDGDVLQIGARRWRIVVGEGHSPEHACLYADADRILLAGDQLLPRISSNVLVMPIEPDADPLSLWLASLRRLEALAPDTLVLPSHDEVFSGLHARTRALDEHHREKLARLQSIVAEAGSCRAFEAMLALFPRLKGPVDDVLALGETLAHLAWLVRRGLLRCDGGAGVGAGGVQRYSRVPMEQVV